MIVPVYLKMYKFIFFLIKLQYSHKNKKIKKIKNKNSLGMCKAYASLLQNSEYFG